VVARRAGGDAPLALLLREVHDPVVRAAELEAVDGLLVLALQEDAVALEPTRLSEALPPTQGVKDPAVISCSLLSMH